MGAAYKSSSKKVVPFVHHGRNLWWNQKGVGVCPAPCTTAAEEGESNGENEGTHTEEVVQPPEHGPLDENGSSPEGNTSSHQDCPDDCPDVPSKCRNAIKWTTTHPGVLPGLKPDACSK